MAWRSPSTFQKMRDEDRQVIIQVRDVQGASGGIGQDDNPFDWGTVCSNIEKGLLEDGFKRGTEDEIMLVPTLLISHMGEVLVILLKRKSLIKQSMRSVQLR